MRKSYIRNLLNPPLAPPGRGTINEKELYKESIKPTPCLPVKRGSLS
jgi:hypothetical protein